MVTQTKQELPLEKALYLKNIQGQHLHVPTVRHRRISSENKNKTHKPIFTLEALRIFTLFIWLYL